MSRAIKRAKKPRHSRGIKRHKSHNSHQQSQVSNNEHDSWSGEGGSHTEHDAICQVSVNRSGTCLLLLLLSTQITHTQHVTCICHRSVMCTANSHSRTSSHVCLSRTYPTLSPQPKRRSFNRFHWRFYLLKTLQAAALYIQSYIKHFRFILPQWRYRENFSYKQFMNITNTCSIGQLNIVYEIHD